VSSYIAHTYTWSSIRILLEPPHRRWNKPPIRLR